MSLDNVLTVAAKFVPLLVTILVAMAILFIIDKSLRHRWRDTPGAQYRMQLIMLVLTLAALIAIVVALPIKDALRGQLLGLLGILLSAAIALSATTFIGNIMAGIMLKAIRNARPGDFITVADLTGRITEMDLLHTEIQTEFRDLVTVPNLYLVSQPVHVVRASGTVISAEVSLGYDVPRSKVADVLRKAAAGAGLKDAFVHVRELGDFSILYRVAGLLEDVTSLISARSRLREAMLDALHAANIEIVSPSFMNSRVYPVEREFIPTPSRKARAREQAQAEEVVFDKAAEVASVEGIRKSIELIDRDIAALGEEGVAKDDERLIRLEDEKTRLQALVAEEEKRLRKAEIEKDG